MKARTLREYFLPSKRPVDADRPKTTFLHLPKHIRRRIYIEAGLISLDPICLNYLEDDDDRPSQGCDPNYPELFPVDEDAWISSRSKSLFHFLDGPLVWPKLRINRMCYCLDCLYATQCDCEPFPYQLLYVSKPVADEVAAIFYAENRFYTYEGMWGDFSGLRYLPRKALSRITSLDVCLEVDMDNTAAAAGIDWDGLREWQAMWKTIKPSIKPNHLKLSLEFHGVGFQASKMLLEPLLQEPTLQLRDCSIILKGWESSTGPHSPLDASLHERAILARQSAQKLTPKHSTKSSFRYMDLPREIRLMILEHTDLVCPFDLAWNSREEKTRSYFEYQPCHAKFYEHKGLQCRHLFCCRKCNPRDLDECSCYLLEPAFSTTCICWTMPKPLFLTCRAMKDDAEFVFYSKNRFLLLCSSFFRGTHLGIYDFLTHLPHSARRYLRSLSLTWLDIQSIL